MLRFIAPFLVALGIGAVALSSSASRSRHHHKPATPPRLIEPIVNTEWLADNLAADDLVIVDIRPEAAYGAAHIPGAVSEPLDLGAPTSAWITTKDELSFERPDDQELFQTIGQLGISANSRVVVVTELSPEGLPEYAFTFAARVADTLIYSGVHHVALLEGGFGKWVDEGLPSTDDPSEIIPVSYSGQTDRSMFVSHRYVERRLWRVPILDTRNAGMYFGTSPDPSSDSLGHIESASSLPTPWVFDEDGMFRDRDVLKQMAQGVIRRSRSREVIVYCGVGGFASVWWYLLTQVLGYRDVKFYDGSTEEWTRHNELVPYRWD